MSHPTITQTIQTLDPDRDHQQICHLLVGYKFSWDSYPEGYQLEDLGPPEMLEDLNRS
jgi:hypothetical protein